MFKMAECNFYETNNTYSNLKPALSDNQQFRLDRIHEIRDYFIAEIKEKESMSKRLSKYISSFDHFGKSLIVFCL